MWQFKLKYKFKKDDIVKLTYVDDCAFVIERIFVTGIAPAYKCKCIVGSETSTRKFVPKYSYIFKEEELKKISIEKFKEMFGEFSGEEVEESEEF